MAHKKGVFEELKTKYWKADKHRKSEILDHVVEVTGLTRKGAIKRFRRMQLRDPAYSSRSGRPVYYTHDVAAALKEVWEIGSQACGENLHPMISEYIDTQIRSKKWSHSDIATAKLRAMSEATVKRRVAAFARTRRNFGGKGTTQKSSLVSTIPIRMDGWDTAEAGVTQVDTVAHGGDNVAGDFIYTVNSADVATLWGTRRAQWNKGQEATKASLSMMRADSPFPWTEIHPDTGKEFINWHLVEYAEETGLRFTRSRPYHKNDNHIVEERNGHTVRVYVGWQRLDVPEVVTALNELYDVLTPYLNHFIASRRIVKKERIGARWKVTREKVARTPYQRVLDRGDVSDEIKEQLRVEHASLDPKMMKAEIDRLTKRVYTIQKRYGSR